MRSSSSTNNFTTPELAREVQHLFTTVTLRSSSTPPRLYETHDDHDVPRFTTPTPPQHQHHHRRRTSTGAALNRVPSNLFSRPSSSSGTSHSIRRTPGIEDLHRPHTRSTSVGAERTRPQVRFVEPVDPSQQQQPSGSRPIPDPHHALRISRRTLSAILVAVEALRTPHPFTPDLEEELAPMSDIMSSSAGRAANGGARPQGPIPVQQTSPATVSRAAVIPPTEIMRRRAERVQAQQDRAQASSEAQRKRLQEEWDTYDSQADAQTAPQQQTSISQPQTQPATQATSSATHRRSRSDAVPPTRATAGQPATAAAYPSPTGPSSQQAAGGFTTPPGAVQPALSIPQPSQHPSAPTAPGSATSRPRANTARQPRPVPPPAAGASGGASRTQAGQTQRPPGGAGSSQTRPPPDAAEIRAERERLAREAGMTAGASLDAQGGTARKSDATVSNFPHAFERWEMLSSKWEGMTSHWISRLQMNSEELQNQPMLAQLSRQVTDLSAAGANLFTALVELQKLRASSERKFQRWFHDTRNEMERQQELVGQLERALIQERRDRADDQVNWEKLVEGARRTEVNFSRANAEKDRELQIAKDESRRAWEELGRYEALERERQKALAQGLPVEIGGYTVYPRMFTESRQGSVSQRDTSVAPGGVHSRDTRPTSRRGPQTSQSIQDDPFVADTGAGDTLEQSEAGTWSPTRSAAGSYAPSYSQAYSTAASGGYTSFSAPPPGTLSDPPAGFYTQANAHLGNDPSEDDYEYERDEAGNILRDEYGRPLSYRRGLHEARSSDSEGDTPGAAPFSSFGGAPHPADRRRVPRTSGQSASAAPAPSSMQTRPEADFGFFNEDEEDDDEEEAGRLEEGVNYHPTRLSDVPEEDELSRASEAGASRGGGMGGVTGAPF